MKKKESKTAKSLIEHGVEMFRLGDFNGALKYFEKELIKDGNNWKALNYKGWTLLRLKKFHEAKICFETSLQIDNNNAETWGFLGTYYQIKNNIDNANSCFTRAEQLEGSELTYSQLAYYYESIQEYKKAEAYVEKTLFINSKNESARNTKGLLYVHKEDYQSAINIFNDLILENSSNSFFYSNLGYTHLLNGGLNKAEEYLKKAISLDPENSYALNNLTILYYNRKNYLTAWNYIDKATVIAPHIPIFWRNKADVLILLIKSGDTSMGTFEDVGSFIVNADISVVDTISTLKNPEIEIQLLQEESNQIILGMIKRDNFFNEIIHDRKVAKEEYLKIYKKSLEIVAILDASHEQELNFAHYTTIETANTLIFDNSPFRLHSVATANDPKEGYPLLNFLGFTGSFSPNIYQAFVGSFTFNPDSLNQFRLYGKKENVEGSGIGLNLSFNYFDDDLQINSSLISPEKKVIARGKQSIFRCIYLDPISRRVVSIGHKEACVFYREYIGEKKEIVDEEVKEYLSKIESLKNNVEVLLEELNNHIHAYYNKEEEIEKKKEIIDVVPLLLIHLRYLVKHYDFKEEQECRIIQVEPLIENSKVKISPDYNRMYIEYLPFRENSDCFLKNIFLGPKVENFELFKDRVTQLNSEILCEKNDHPFS